MTFINSEQILNNQNFNATAIDESAEYRNLISKNGNQIITISISLIHENKLNHRSLSEIDILAESIRSTGRLISPIVVYKEDNHYNLISGHRRYLAWKSLVANPEIEWSNDIPALVVEKPTDEIEERMLMSQANMHRWSPEQRKEEINISLDIWKSLPPEKLAYFTAKLKENFIIENKDNPAFSSDPSKFLRDHFRPKWEFVKMNTGITSSNKTIMKISASDSSDTHDPNNKEHSPHVKNIKIIKKIRSTIQDIEKLEPKEEYKGNADECIRCLSSLARHLEENNNDAV